MQVFVGMDMEDIRWKYSLEIKRNTALYNLTGQLGVINNIAYFKYWPSFTNGCL